MVPTASKPYLGTRNGLKVMSVPIVYRSPCAWRPQLCLIWFSTRLCVVAFRVELGERERKRWKIWELISSWKTLCMLAGYSYSNQNSLNFSLCFGSWARILSWTKQMWFGMCAESQNAEAELCWLSCYCTSLKPRRIKLGPVVHLCVVSGLFLG